MGDTQRCNSQLPVQFTTYADVDPECNVLQKKKGDQKSNGKTLPMKLMWYDRKYPELTNGAVL